MKSIIASVTFTSLFILGAVNAQNVGINTATPDPSSLLDLNATDRGLLVPRVALTASNSATPVTAPATSLLVYNTASAGVTPNDVTPGYYYWDGTVWVRLSTGKEGWSITGNSGTTVGTNFIGTTDSEDFAVYTNNTEAIRVDASGNVGIGETAPSEALDVNGNIEMNGALRGTGRVYATNATEVTYTSPSWVTNASISLPAGTWIIYLQYEAKGWEWFEDFMQYRLRDITQGTDIIGTGTGDWLYLYYMTSDSGSNDYWIPLNNHPIYTVPSGTSTINFDIYGDYDVKIKNTVIFALRID